jgi:hypothetical protein
LHARICDGKSCHLIDVMWCDWWWRRICVTASIPIYAFQCIYAFTMKVWLEYWLNLFNMIYSSHVRTVSIPTVNSLNQNDNNWYSIK